MNQTMECLRNSLQRYLFHPFFFAEQKEWLGLNRERAGKMLTDLIQFLRISRIPCTGREES